MARSLEGFTNDWFIKYSSSKSITDTSNYCSWSIRFKDFASLLICAPDYHILNINYILYAHFIRLFVTGEGWGARNGVPHFERPLCVWEQSKSDSNSFNNFSSRQSQLKEIDFILFPVWMQPFWKVSTQNEKMFDINKMDSTNLHSCLFTLGEYVLYKNVLKFDY